MSFAPASLRSLGAFYEAQGGINLGIVGNAAHTSGYHLGRDRIYDGSGPGLGDNDYSVKLARDKSGLTDAASAIDLGKINGSLAQLRAFSRWLVAQCQASAAVRHDIREIIYTPDGATVQRYSGVDNKIHTGAGNGDSSHLTHTHISYYRDSQDRDKIAVFAPYFTEADMGLSIMLDVTKNTDPYDGNLGTAKLNSGGAKRVSDGAAVALANGTDLGVVQTGTMGSSAIVAFNHDGQLHVTARSNVSFTPLPKPAPPPPNEAQLAQAKLDGARQEYDNIVATATVVETIKYPPRP